MKRHFVTRLSILLVVVGFGPFIASAADPQPPEGPPPGRGQGGRGGANFQGPRGGGAAGMGILDDQQRELYRDATQKNSEELRKLDEKLRAAQKELIQATLAEKYDENVVRTKAEAVAKVQVEITTLRAKAFSVVAPTLKPEQREQLENSRMGAAMLLGAPGGFGGGFGPGANPPPGRRGQGGQ